MFVCFLSARKTPVPGVRTVGREQPVMLPGGSQAAKVVKADLTKRQIEYSAQKSVLAALKKLRFDLDPRLTTPALEAAEKAGAPIAWLSIARMPIEPA